jgi:predicted phosphoribosyltransferase
MRSLLLTACAVGALALAGCQSREADAVEDQAEMTADNLENQAAAAPTEMAEEKLENQADRVEQAGENAAARIDNGTATRADMNAAADAMAKQGETPTR